MSELKADIEQYKNISNDIINMWGDTYHFSDSDINKHLYILMFAMLETDNKAMVEHKAAAECEFLMDMLSTNCRHNTYARNI